SRQPRAYRGGNSLLALKSGLAALVRWFARRHRPSPGWGGDRALLSFTRCRISRPADAGRDACDASFASAWLQPEDADALPESGVRRLDGAGRSALPHPVLRAHREGLLRPAAGDRCLWGWHRLAHGRRDRRQLSVGGRATYLRRRVHLDRRRL